MTDQRDSIWRTRAGRLRRVLARCVVAWVAGGVVASGQGVDGEGESGACAPPGCWCLDGGAPAGTGAASTALAEFGHVPRWTIDVGNPLDTEPRVWQDDILLDVSVGPGRRSLRLLDRFTGAERHRLTWATRESLEPSIWHRDIVCRIGPRELAQVRIVGGRLQEGWRATLDGNVSAPVFLEGQVFVRAGDELVALDAANGRVQWSGGTQVRGRPSVRGAHVYALDYQRSGAGYLLVCQRSDGARVAHEVAGHHGGVIPDLDATPRLQVLAHGVLVHHVLPVAIDGGGVATGTWLSRTRRNGRVSFRFRTLLQIRGEAVPHADGWTGRALIEGDLALIHAPRSGDLNVLVPGGRGHALLAEELAVARAGGVCLLGTHLVRAADREVVGRLSIHTSERVVPCTEGVLVRDGSRLTHLAPPSPARAPWASRALEGTRGRAPLHASVVTRDGRRLHGKAALEGPRGGHALLALSGQQPPRRPLAHVAAVVGDGGELLAGSPRDLVAGLERCWVDPQVEGYLELATDAGRVGDGERMRRLLEAVRYRGVGAGPTLTALEAQASRLPARNRSISKSVLRTFDERERTLARLPLDRLESALTSLDRDAPGSVRVALLRGLLERDPRHDGARAEIDALLPFERPPESPAVEWLDLLAALDAFDVTVSSPESPPTERASAAELERLTRTWRPDLLMLSSPRLRLVTPRRFAGRIARCLRIGEQVCDHLDELYAFSRRRGASPGPLVLYLYETEEAYRRHSGGGDGSGEWTSGHYSPRDRLARLFLPPDDDDFTRVQSTFVHELTHHWCWERCPLVRDALRRGPNPRVPGFWIIEGFASFVESWRLDLERSSWEAPGLASDLDVVASTPASVRVPWDRLFQLSQAQFAQLDRAVSMDVPLTTSLGRGRLVGETTMFYAQSAAAVHYLYFAEGGRHRRALLEFVAHALNGDAARLDVSRVFGLSALELGTRIDAYAEAQQAPWRGGSEAPAPSRR